MMQKVPFQNVLPFSTFPSATRRTQTVLCLGAHATISILAHTALVSDLLIFETRTIRQLHVTLEEMKE
jgi:hypothetical protein